MVRLFFGRNGFGYQGSQLPGRRASPDLGGLCPNIHSARNLDASNFRGYFQPWRERIQSLFRRPHLPVLRARRRSNNHRLHDSLPHWRVRHADLGRVLDGNCYRSHSSRLWSLFRVQISAAEVGVTFPPPTALGEGQGGGIEFGPLNQSPLFSQRLSARYSATQDRADRPQIA